MGNITIQGDITATVPGNAVGGASALTTPGSVPFVTAAGVLGQDAGLAWDSTNKQLSLFRNSADASRVRISNTNGAAQILVTATGATQIRNEASGQPIIFEQSTERARFAATSGNLLLGTTTDDGTSRLQVNGNLIVNGGNALRLQNAAGNQFASMMLNANSIVTVNYPFSVGPNSALTSAVTFGVHDGTPTTGSTSLVVRAGAGQGSNDLTQFVTLASGTSGVRSNGVIYGGTSVAIGTVGGSANPFGILLGSGADLRWSNAAAFGAGTPDLSLSRASSGVLQVGDGGPNQLGQLSARAINAVSSLVAFNSTGGIYMSGNTGSSWGTIQSYSDAAGTAKATAINPTGGNLLLGTTTDDGTNRLQVAGGIGVTTNASGVSLQVPNAGAMRTLTGASTFYFDLGQMHFRSGVGAVLGGGSVVWSGTTGNWTMGGVVDGNFKLDVASSGSSGGLRVWDQAPTTGSTSLVVRAGAGQGGNQLVRVRNSGDTLNLFSIESTGRVITDSVYDSRTDAFSYGTSAAFASGGQVTFGPNLTTYYTPDVAIGRFGVGRAQINNGTAIGTTPGNARDIMLRRTFAAETTTDPSAADLTIAGSNTQDVAAIYVKNDKLVVAYNRSGTVNYLTIPLDGATTTFTQSTTAP